MNWLTVERGSDTFRAARRRDLAGSRRALLQRRAEMRRSKSRLLGVPAGTASAARLADRGSRAVIFDRAATSHGVSCAISTAIAW